MNPATGTSRPSLIALQPARLATALRLLGAAPRDLVGMDMPLIAMLLCDLSQQQRREHIVPLLIIPPDMIGVRRLVANSALVSVVTSGGAQIETIARWALAPLQINSGQVWVQLSR